MNGPAAWAVVVAAGRGDRFGGPKQLEEMGGRRLVDWAVAAAREACAGVVLVAPPDCTIEDTGADVVVAGGLTRSDSVRAGLASVPDVDVVVIHDAARPLAPSSLFAAVIAAVQEGATAAVPGLAVADTLKEVDDGRVVRTVPRDRLVSVQTPQAFSARALRSAHERGGDATDDAGLIEAAGGDVVVVPGDPRAFKVTTPADLELVRVLARA